MIRVRKDFKEKIVDRSAIFELLREVGHGKIVFTNGCFDIIHPGHISYLFEAAKLGDIFIVGINSDSSVKALKGESRPIIPERERAEHIAALQFVVFVTIFSELTPEKTISYIQPDIHVKGGDYSIDDLPEKAVVEKYGGRIELIKFIDGFSSTELINKLTGK